MWYYYFMFFMVSSAMIANSIPVLARKISFLNYPIHEKVLGSHKTWRGIFFGLLWVLIYAYMLWWLSFLFFGFFSWLWALMGDCFKSYLKRKNNIMSGASWYPWDQIDYIIGMVIFTLPFYNWTIKELIVCCCIGWLASYGAHYAAYVLKLINTKH